MLGGHSMDTQTSLMALPMREGPLVLQLDKPPHSPHS